jgi:hypothetical protein
VLNEVGLKTMGNVRGGKSSGFLTFEPYLFLLKEADSLISPFAAKI